MTSVAPNPGAVDSFEVARAELVEALARMVNRVIQHGKAEVQSALGSIEQIRTTLAGVAKLDDFLEDLDAAERALRLYLST
jgi:methyl-accepting chemotaxis protein